MQPYHVALSIDDQRDVAIFSDGHLGPLNLPAATRGAALLNGTVITMEIYEGSVTARREPIHFDKGSRSSVTSVHPERFNLLKRLTNPVIFA
jgi:hypothetical protein